MALSDADVKRLMPFSYDEWMLREMTTRLRNRDRPLAEWNALVESFGMHARAVAEFFLPKERKRGERKGAGAVDFLPGGHRYWNQATGLSLDGLHELKNRVGREIAHITHEREGFVLGPDWDVDREHAFLKPHVDRFAQETGWTPYALTPSLAQAVSPPTVPFARLTATRTSSPPDDTGLDYGTAHSTLGYLTPHGKPPTRVNSISPTVASTTAGVRPVRDEPES